MFSLLKSAIKKDSSTKNEASSSNLDDFFSKGARKEGQDNKAAADTTKRPSDKGKGSIQSYRSDFRASEYGLVIRNLDEERAGIAKNQSGLADNDTVQGRPETSGQETAAASGAVEVSGTVQEANMQSRPASDLFIGEGFSAGEKLPGDLNDRGQNGDIINEDDEVTNNTSDQHGDDYASEKRLSVPEKGTIERGEEPNPSDRTSRNFDDEIVAGARQDQLMEKNDGLTQQAREEKQAGEGLDHAAWEPRNLDEELNRTDQQDPDGLQSVAANAEDTDRIEEPRYHDEGYELDDNRSDQGYEDQDEANDDSRFAETSLDKFDTRPDIDDTLMDLSQGSRTPTRNEADDVDELPDSSDELSGYPDDNYSNADGTPLRQEDGVDMNDGRSEYDHEYGEGENSEEHSDQQDNDIGSELADSIQPDEEAFEGSDGASNLEDNYSENEIEEQPEEFDEAPDARAPDVDAESNAEDIDRDLDEQNSHISDDPLNDDDGLNGDHGLEGDDDLDGDRGQGEDEGLEEDEGVEEDVGLEGEDDLEVDEGLDEGDDIEADEGLDEGDDMKADRGVEEGDNQDGGEDLDEDEGLNGDDNQDGDDGLEEDDGLRGADEQSVISGPVAEGERSDLGSNPESQADMEESAPDNPLAVPGRQWTEAHMEAFRIHVRSKTNIFDFLARKDVSNRERLCEVVAESLKLCLKDPTALHGKTHATVFMEAGATPLGPFLAFLALTVQSTMNSSKDEKTMGEKAKDEKMVKDGEEASEEKEPEAASAADDADEWDDFDVMEDLEAPPSHFEPPKPAQAEPKSAHESDVKDKRPEVATNIMVVMFLQAVLESSRAAIKEPAKAYLEWTFIPQPLEINSGPANCEYENDGSLHDKKAKRTAGEHVKWEDVNPLEYVSIGVSLLFGKLGSVIQLT
jgi:hypothetical protein